MLVIFARLAVTSIHPACVNAWNSRVIGKKGFDTPEPFSLKLSCRGITCHYQRLVFATLLEMQLDRIECAQGDS